MNDFSTRLTALLDDVAAGITPRPDFEAARAGVVPVVAGGQGAAHRFRRPALAAAAAAMVLAGGVAAAQVAGNDGPSVSSDRSDDLSTIEIAEPVITESDGDDLVLPAERPGRDGPVSPAVVSDGASSDDDAADRVEPSARLGELIVVGDVVMKQRIVGTAPHGAAVIATSDHSRPSVALASDGKWALTVDLIGVDPGGIAVIEIAVGDDATFRFEVRRPEQAPVEEEPEAAEEPQQPKPEPEAEPKPEPKEEPKPEPQPVEFTSHLGNAYNDATYMKQGFYGTATPGTRIVAASEWGAVDTTAGPKGQWEMRLILTGVPDDTVVRVEVAASTGGSAVYEIVRAAPVPEPKVVEFTSQLGDVHDTDEYFKPILFGTGTPGSVVVAGSAYGTQDVEVNADGNWEIGFKLFEVPRGTWVVIEVSNSQSEKEFRYEVQRPEADEPVVEFTAQAAFVECDAPTPFNEYWGTAQPGATITISSAHGGGQVTADGAGNWEARIEFPEAPLGESFGVVLSNSASGVVYEKPFKRVEPG